MKSKKSKKSYADLAKAVISKYKKRLGDDLSRYDKLATESLNRELSALMAEQEAYKQAELEKEYQQMCKGGKLRKMWDGGSIDTFPLRGPYQRISRMQPRTTNYPIPENISSLIERDLISNVEPSIEAPTAKTFDYSIPNRIIPSTFIENNKNFIHKI